MKKMMFLLVVVLLGFQAAARKGQPILPYGDYSIEDVRTFALSDSEKAKEFRRVLVPLVQRKLDESGENLKLSESHVSWIFDQVVEQEAWLEARQFKNSRWMPEEKVIDFYVSETRYEGSAGIFVYGKCSFPLYKTSCANLLEANLNRVPSSTPVETEIQKHTVLKIDTIYDTYVKNDTVYQPVWVEEPERFVESRVEVVYVEQPHAYYEPIFRPVFMPVFMPYIAPQWGGGYNNVCVNNNNYYSSNTVINNTNINNTRIVNNRRESGGPVGVPGHDAGSPAGAPGFPAGAPGGVGGHPAGAPGYESGDGGPNGAGGFSARAQSQTIDSRVNTKSASVSNGSRRTSTVSSNRSWRSSNSSSTNSVSRSRISNSLVSKPRSTSGRTSAIQTKSANTFQRNISRTPSSYSQRSSSTLGRSSRVASTPNIRSSSYGGGMPRSTFSGGSSMRSFGTSGMSRSGGGASRSMSSGGRR